MYFPFVKVEIHMVKGMNAGKGLVYTFCS